MILLKKIRIIIKIVLKNCFTFVHLICFSLLCFQLKNVFELPFLVYAVNGNSCVGLIKIKQTFVVCVYIYIYIDIYIYIYIKNVINILVRIYYFSYTLMR